MYHDLDIAYRELILNGTKEFNKVDLKSITRSFDKRKLLSFERRYKPNCVNTRLHCLPSKSYFKLYIVEDIALMCKSLNRINVCYTKYLSYHT